jgi:hypothetical protein
LKSKRVIGNAKRQELNERERELLLKVFVVVVVVVVVVFSLRPQPCFKP